MLIISTFLFGCTSQVEENNTSKIEQLYVVSINDAISNIENNSEIFIYVKGASKDTSKERIVRGFSNSTLKFYDYEKVKNDNTKFEYDSEGNIVKTKSGYIVEVEIENYSENQAELIVKVWSDEKKGFQIDYLATYDNKWLLDKQKGLERKN